MKPSVLFSLGCTFYLGSCATATIAPTPSPSVSETPPPTLPTPTPLPSFGPENPDNPCPDFHLTPQNLELPVEKITNAPPGLNAMCSSPSTGDLYLLTDTEIFRFDTNTQQAQKAIENPPDFKELVACTVDNQENIYLADQGTEQLLQYHNTNKTWTELESRVNGFSLLGQYLSLHMSPQQELFLLHPNGEIIHYYTHDLKLKTFELNYRGISLERFNRESYSKLFLSETLKTIKNTVITDPSDFTFGPQQMFVTTPSGWNELFSINLTSGEIAPLPSVKQRGETAFIEKSNFFLSRSLFLTYSPRYNVLYQLISVNNGPAWTSLETGCWQGLSTVIPRGLAEGGDGHLYLIGAKTRSLHRIKLSPEIFQSPTAQPSTSD